MQRLRILENTIVAKYLCICTEFKYVHWLIKMDVADQATDYNSNDACG